MDYVTVVRLPELINPCLLRAMRPVMWLAHLKCCCSCGTVWSEKNRRCLHAGVSGWRLEQLVSARCEESEVCLSSLDESLKSLAVWTTPHHWLVCSQVFPSCFLTFIIQNVPAGVECDCLGLVLYWTSISYQMHSALINNCKKPTR